MVHTQDTEHFAAMCKALGHPARVMIINYLKKIDRCFCGDIVELLPLAQSTVSEHLRILKAGRRPGDSAPMAIVQLLDQPVATVEAKEPRTTA